MVTETQIKHLELIQAIINRMNGNSFQIKACSITILSILFAIYAVNGNAFVFLLAALPTLLFWFLDSYYLQQERKFRGLYNTIIGTRDYITDAIKPFEMPIEKLKDSQFNYWRVLFSRTILFFHGAILAISILLFAIITYCH